VNISYTSRKVGHFQIYDEHTPHALIPKNGEIILLIKRGPKGDPPFSDFSWIIKKIDHNSFKAQYVIKDATGNSIARWNEESHVNTRTFERMRIKK
jgi:hypothetical protein